METAPIWIDAFVQVIVGNQVAQVATVAVLLLILLDVLYGVCAAIARKEYSSEKMREGIGHKSAELGFMLVGVVVDGAILGGFDLGYTAPMYTAICAYLALMEIGSLLETFSRMNPQLAGSPIFRLLEQNSEESEE